MRVISRSDLGNDTAVLCVIEILPGHDAAQDTPSRWPPPPQTCRRSSFRWPELFERSASGPLLPITSFSTLLSVARSRAVGLFGFRELRDDFVVKWLCIVQHTKLLEADAYLIGRGAKVFSLGVGLPIVLVGENRLAPRLLLEATVAQGQRDSCPSSLPPLDPDLSKLHRLATPPVGQRSRLSLPTARPASSVSSSRNAWNFVSCSLNLDSRAKSFFSARSLI
jgi:hypothetical protein